MSSAIRSRLTSANVISVIALFLALSGGAYALKLGRNTIGSKQIKANAVKASEAKESTFGTVPSASNANKLGGQPASFYAQAATLRTALVAADGTVDAARSDGVSPANVTDPVSGLYCFNGLSPAPRSVVASIAGGTAGIQTQTTYNPAAGSCAGSQFSVATLDDANNLVADAFTVFIH